MCSILISGGSDNAAFSMRPASSRPPIKVVKLEGVTPYSSFRIPRIQTLAVSWYSAQPTRFPMRSAGFRIPAFALM